jgi:hypothetical protein
MKHVDRENYNPFLCLKMTHFLNTNLVNMSNKDVWHFVAFEEIPELLGENTAYNKNTCCNKIVFREQVFLRPTLPTRHSACEPKSYVR